MDDLLPRQLRVVGARASAGALNVAGGLALIFAILALSAAWLLSPSRDA